MSIDKLQNGIRKLKNPSMVAFSFDKTQIPPAYVEAAPSGIRGYGVYAKELLSALKGIVPAVRFAFGSFAVAGVDGLQMLAELLSFAKEQGFYVLLDAPDVNIFGQVKVMADALLENWEFDGLAVGCYLGSDVIKPYAEAIKDTDKDLFVLFRTGNKSASELQDLLSGSRLLYMAAADMAIRLGDGMIDKCGYSRLAGVGPATSPDGLRNLRVKYPTMFLLIDGYDYPGANAKNCSVGFDRLGHGAVACAGKSIVAAWSEEDGDAIVLAVEAAERMKKNLSRYVTIL